VPIRIKRKNDPSDKGVLFIPYNQQPIPRTRNDAVPANWKVEAVVCQSCGWSGKTRLNGYWTLDKFVCPDCRGKLALDT
jgi:hypothetical protein